MEPIHLFSDQFFLEYSCFAVLCQFLLYSKMNQPYIYTQPLPFGLPSRPGHHSALSRVLCARSSLTVLQIDGTSISFVTCFIHSINSAYVSIPGSQFLSPLPFPLGVHTFVLYVCVSISALQIRSPVGTASSYIKFSQPLLRG